MSEQIIKIAQANDPILNNLVNTENQLNQLNQEVGLILQDYQAVNISKPSFFNFDNPFFLLTLVGLIMLVFTLWFLQQELKYLKPKKNSPFSSRSRAAGSPPKLEGEREGVKINRKEEVKIKASKVVIGKKVRKIKVVKVK